jgi:hypothetical protein
MDVGRKHTDEGGRSRGLFAWPEDSRHPAVSYEYHVESLGVLSLVSSLIPLKERF